MRRRERCDRILFRDRKQDGWSGLQSIGTSQRLLFEIPSGWRLKPRSSK
jgi:hypothetical protein